MSQTSSCWCIVVRGMILNAGPSQDILVSESLLPKSNLSSGYGSRMYSSIHSSIWWLGAKLAAAERNLRWQDLKSAMGLTKISPILMVYKCVNHFWKHHQCHRAARYTA